MYIVQVSLLLIGYRAWDISSGFPLAGGLRKFYANAGGKHPIQRQLLIVQYKQQTNSLLLTHNYALLVISRNDKNKQLTLLLQCKLGNEYLMLGDRAQKLLLVMYFTS